MKNDRLTEQSPLILPAQLAVSSGLLFLYLLGQITGIAALIIGLTMIGLLYGIERSHRQLVRRLSDTVKLARAPRRNLAPLRAKIAEGIDAPLLLIDPGRKVLDANRPARSLFGERLIGREISLHMRHPDILDALAKVMKGATTIRLDVTLTTPVERNFTVSVSRVENSRPPQSNLIHDEAEPDYYVVISMHDTTQMKAAERMRADFVANASHELRTPLSSLIGFIETMRGPAKDDLAAQERFLGIMHEESQRMVRLIDDLLSLSRIELDKHVQPQTSADCLPILKNVVDSLEPGAAKRSMRLLIKAKDPLPPVRGDRDQIHQMLQNLVSNAMKYAYEGTDITLHAQRVERMPEGGKAGLAITINDQGAGIAPEHIPRLTERFYRVDAARSRKLGGTGLGLAIVKHIVTRHRGYLHIESTLGVGTSVTVTLPLATADENAPHPHPHLQAEADPAMLLSGSRE
ncbi:histidine kinase [Iodidimonas nitroreducens]|uniref:histidine kinase n=1 Tax=Iodidimonas nitroreducens TaxID=1236968 RepID=A0A5A7N952_9PROT|nr:ATP-binding protein [Iodidimonas nitroreducens]GAK32262.1 phosphate regulon sensor protein PhoR [alpha proteobacterium Q-1]GER04872.1 histidine kinase [Iodidimonas nitroreducens]